MTTRRLVDLSVEEAHGLLTSLGQADLPPLEAVENEDWGRDWLLQRLEQLGPAKLLALGLTLDDSDAPG